MTTPTTDDPAALATLERVTFIVADTDERISALLNPNSVEMKRRSGLAAIAQRPGMVAGVTASDDLLIATGGGRTEITLDLLFDVDLVPSVPPVTDVRHLTGPLWTLSENRALSGVGGPPALVLVWGKAWLVYVIVESVSEKLERFDRAGAPARSWLRVRLLRTVESDPTAVGPRPGPIPFTSATPRAPFSDVPGAVYHQVIGSGGDPAEGHDGERLDELAHRYLGDPAYWRHLASINGIEDPPWVAPGTVLVIPPLDVLRAPEGPGETARTDSGTGSTFRLDDIHVAVDIDIEVPW